MTDAGRGAALGSGDDGGEGHGAVGNAERVAWAKGGSAALAAIEGDHVRLVSTVPAAPGTPLDGALCDGARLRVKVARCKRDGDAFVIEGRLVDASRALRARLAAIAPPPSA